MWYPWAISMNPPREIFRVAIIVGAYAIALMHNHPSGDPSPSLADREITRRLRDTAELLQVNLPEPARDSFFHQLVLYHFPVNGRKISIELRDVFVCYLRE